MECPVVLPQGQQVAPEQAHRPSFPDALVTAAVETPVSDGAGAPPQPHEQWWECCPLRAPLASPCHNGIPCGVLVSVCVKGRANGAPRGVGQQELRWCLRVCGQSPGGRAIRSRCTCGAESSASTSLRPCWRAAACLLEPRAASWYSGSAHLEPAAGWSLQSSG